jgi:hypothetical protein
VGSVRRPKKSIGVTVSDPHFTFLQLGKGKGFLVWFWERKGEYAPANHLSVHYMQNEDLEGCKEGHGRRVGV